MISKHRSQPALLLALKLMCIQKYHICGCILGSEMYKRDCCVYIKEAESDDLPEAEPEGDKATCPKLPLEWSATATIGVVCHCHH